MKMIFIKEGFLAPDLEFIGIMLCRGRQAHPLV